MKLCKKIMSVIVVAMLLMTLTACGSFESKAKNNIKSYMKTMTSLTKDNYVSWVNENLGNPYSGVGLALEELPEGEIEYFIKCLSMIKYEITTIDETNKYAAVNVTYVDSTEYIKQSIGKLLEYAFSADYTKEGESQIYIDVMNSIEEYQFLDDTIYFGLNDDASIGIATSNTFDVATAGLYKLMIGDPNQINNQSEYSEEELLANIEVECEIIDENNILVKFTNNNEIPVYPYADLIFVDKDGNYVIQSQAGIKALPAGGSCYTYAYNELSDDVVDFDIEKHVEYYNPEDITFYDESAYSYEISQTEDEVDITFTNNTDETISICGGYIVYGVNGDIVYVGDIYIPALDPGQSDNSWFYLNCTYDEENDIWTPDPYDHIEMYPIAHSNAESIWF